MCGVFKFELGCWKYSLRFLTQRNANKWGIKMSNKVVCFPLFNWGHGLSDQVWFMYVTHSCIVFNDVRECLTQEKRRLQHFPEDSRTRLILNYHSRSLIRALCFQATQSRFNAQLIVMLSTLFVFIDRKFEVWNVM